MNYDQNISREKKRKRIAVGILFLVYLLYGFPDPSETSILEFATAQMLPLFTYEKEYGTCCAEYDSGYEVPDWFYEDEMEQPVNDNLAVAEKQKEAEQPPVNEHFNDQHYVNRIFFLIRYLLWIATPACPQRKCQRTICWIRMFQ